MVYTVSRWRRFRQQSCVLLLGALVQSEAALAQLPAPLRATAAAPLIFRGVTVIDVTDGARRAKQTVVIVGNRIQAIGPMDAIAVPRGARVVNARNKYVIPGFWDIHTHWVSPTRGERKRGEYLVGQLAFPCQWRDWDPECRLRCPAGDVGRGEARDRRRQPNRSANACRGGPQVHDWCGGDKGGTPFCVTTPADARRIVDSLKAAGADFIKSYGVRSDLFYALANEARRVGIPVDGHLSAGLSAAEASDSGQRIQEHMYDLPGICGGPNSALEELDTAASLEKCTALAARYRHNGTWSQLGPLTGGFRRRWPARLTDATIFARLRYLPRRFRLYPFPGPVERFAAHPEALALVQGADLPILLGSDVVIADSAEWRLAYTFPDATLVWLMNVPGFSLPDQMAFAVEHGLTPLRALQATTIAPARALGMTDSLGMVASGQVADLVLLDADPLADIYNAYKIWAVVSDGRYYDRATLDALLKQVANHAR